MSIGRDSTKILKKKSAKFRKTFTCSFGFRMVSSKTCLLNKKHHLPSIKLIKLIGQTHQTHRPKWRNFHLIAQFGRPDSSNSQTFLFGNQRISDCFFGVSESCWTSKSRNFVDFCFFKFCWWNKNMNKTYPQKPSCLKTTQWSEKKNSKMIILQVLKWPGWGSRSKSQMFVSLALNGCFQK